MLPLRIGGIQSTKIVIQKHYIELTTLGRGFWEFASVAKLYYHGKLFAIVGTAVGVDKNVQDGINGRLTSMVIYDEDGDGSGRADLLYSGLPGQKLHRQRFDCESRRIRHG